MAKRVTVALVDDLDGVSPADETIPFSIDREQFEIDLSAEHAQTFREWMSQYTRVARRVGKPRKRPVTNTSKSQSEQHEIREWCRANGIDVADRGRIPREALEAWENRGIKETITL